MTFSVWLKGVLGMATEGKGNTFSALEADVATFQETDFPTFFQKLYGSVQKLKTDREDFYRRLRDSGSGWIRRSRWTLSILAVAAVLLTALAGIAALADAPEPWLKPMQTKGLVGAFVIYAIMGAIALFERGTSLTASYFRHLTITIAIRNLWNDFQLTLLAEYPGLASKATSDPEAARARAVELASAFCKDIDKLVTAEQTEWHTEFTESLKALDTVANQGMASVKTDLQAAMVKVTKAAEEAKAAAEHAKAAVTSGDLNVTVTGDFDGNLVVLIDQSKRHDQPGMKKFAIRGVVPGTHEIQVNAKRGAEDIAFSEVLEVKPGIQAYNITFS